MEEQTLPAVGAPLERHVVPSVVDTEKFVGQGFRLRKSENLCGERTIWLDLYGSSYVPAATCRRSATAMARQLRLAADWLDRQKTHAFRKRTPARAKGCK